MMVDIDFKYFLDVSLFLFLAFGPCVLLGHLKEGPGHFQDERQNIFKKRGQLSPCSTVIYNISDNKSKPCGAFSITGFIEPVMSCISFSTGSGGEP